MAVRGTQNVARDAWEVFMQLSQVHAFCMQHTLQKYGLYEGQPAFLFQIRDLGKPSQNELAQTLGISKSSAGVSLRRLEKNGFVKREQDPADSRCNRISLTKKGQEFTRWCEMDVDMIANNLLEEFEGEEREQALRTLNRMLKGLNAMRERIKS